MIWVQIHNINWSFWGLESLSEQTAYHSFQKLPFGDLDLQDENEKLRTAVKAHLKINALALSTKLGVAFPIARRHLVQISKVKRMQKLVHCYLTDWHLLHFFFFLTKKIPPPFLIMCLLLISVFCIIILFSLWQQTCFLLTFQTIFHLSPKKFW